MNVHVLGSESAPTLETLTHIPSSDRGQCRAGIRALSLGGINRALTILTRRGTAPFALRGEAEALGVEAGVFRMR